MDDGALSLSWLILLTTTIALALAAAAQVVVRMTKRQTERSPARMSGFAAARRLLDDAGLQDVVIEQTPGVLSDHYEPRRRVLRLSGSVYHGRSLAAVGAAVHEAGHALQQEAGDWRVGLLGVAGFASSFGSGAGIVLMLLALGLPPLSVLGASVFSFCVLVQLLNLPAEFNAASRAQQRIEALDLVDPGDRTTTRLVIRVSSLTYLAGTLQTVVATLTGLARYMARRA